MDIPLIEMNEEDDEELTDPNQPPLLFTCSPFALPPSRTHQSLKDSVRGMDKPSTSSSEASNNKENINVEVPKLGMEPMQMKRRKKVGGGGYNLRKSLAWDRAFFTDEGILDPSDLALITGINANTCGGGLASISEEGNSACSSGNRCRDGPNDTEAASEEARRAVLHDKSRTPKGSKYKTGSSLGNHDSSSHRKNLNSRTLKRPANSNILKTAGKESKLPKIPLSKPGSCLSVTTKGSTTASQLRHNMIPKSNKCLYLYPYIWSTINVQKNVGMKTSVKNAHVSQSKTKTCSGSINMPAKELPQRTVRNLGNSFSKEASSTKSRSVQVDRANTGSGTVPDKIQLREPVPRATKSIAPQTITDSNNSLPEVARVTTSGAFHIHRATKETIPDCLQSCDSQECPSVLAAPHHTNLSNIGAHPPNIQPARPSGLRMPSPSLRFFDQKTDSESGSLQQKKTQQCTTSMGSNRRNGDLRPPAAPARTPLKSNNIMESIRSVVLTPRGQCYAPSILSTPCSSIQSSPNPNYSGNTVKGVPDSSMYTNPQRAIAPMIDIKLRYECRGSEFESHKVTEQEGRVLGHEETMEMEKIVCKGVEDIKASHLNEQLEEGNGANICFSGNVGYNKVGVGTNQLMSGSVDGSAPLIPETKDKSVFHNDEGRLQSYTAISMSTSGQSILHQEQSISTTVAGSTEFRQNLAPTPRKQADTEESDVSKVDFESHLDAGRLEAEDRVSELFLESQKDETGRGDDHGATQWVSSSLEHCVVMQHEELGQENAVMNVVDDKSSRMEDDARCNIGSACSVAKRRISITSRDSLEDEAGYGGITDAIELKGKVTMIDTSCIPCQGTITEQRNDDVYGLFIVSSRSPVKDVETLVLHDYPSAECIHVNLQDSPLRESVTLLSQDSPSAESYHIEPGTSFKNKDELHDSCVRDAVTLLLHDNQLTDGAEGVHFTPSILIKNKAQLQDSGTGTESAKCFEATTRVPALQKSQFNLSTESSSPEENQCPNMTEGIDHMEVPGEKQDVVDVALITGKLLANGQVECREVASLIDDHNQSGLSHLLTTKSVLEMAECATTSQGLHIEGLDIAAVTTEDEHKHEENDKSQEMGIITESLSKKSLVAEQSQRVNIMKTNQTVQGCAGGSKTYTHFQSENPTLEGTETGIGFSETHVEDAQVQLLDGDVVHSCSMLTSVLHNHSIENFDHKQPELANTEIELEQSDVYECDPKQSDTIVHALTVGQELEYEISCSTVIDSVNEHKNYADNESTYNAECGDLAHLSELESLGGDKMVGAKTTCMDYNLASEPMLEKKETLFGALFGIERVSADNDRVCIKEGLSPEKIANLDKPNNALDSTLVVPEHECDLQTPHASTEILPAVQGNVSGFNRDNQPNEPQGSIVILPSMETYDYFTNEESGRDLEFCVQDPSESNSSFPVSPQLKTCVKTTNTTLCSVTAEIHSGVGKDESLLTNTYRIGAEGSKISIEEAEEEVLQEEKIPMVGEFSHESDGGCDFKENKDAAMLTSNNIKKQDKSLVIHPPNAVPFSDEWLAAIEAAGEEILTMKCGAVQHSPQDKSLPEPSPWSPVKKKATQIGPYDCTKYTNAMPSNSH
ncbi:hypothetical protein CTI12_AA250280 [Artemisia annua]|uniref:Uncharacterized protein n=1 Tax=Artemisia annua TaxID=35608 RepID=A0A2U1NMD7_ARTAN|nr:hypothetical protein CTI12_AA250280 [Artemisia annua]